MRTPSRAGVSRTAAPLAAPWTFAPDAGRRALVTVGALVVFFVGRKIPFPMLAPDAAAKLSPMLGGADKGRLSVFALGVVPIYSALLLVNLAEIFIPSIGRWSNATPSNRRWMNGSARLLALVFAAFQALEFGQALQRFPEVTEGPGWLFLVVLVFTMTGATAFLCWLIDFISRRGLGDGFMVLLATGFLTLWPAKAKIYDDALNRGDIGGEQATVFYFMLLACLAALIFVSAARPKADEPRPGVDGLAEIDFWPTALAFWLSSFGAVLAGFLLSKMGLTDGAAAAAILYGVEVLLFAGLLVAATALRFRGNDLFEPQWRFVCACVAVYAALAGWLAFGPFRPPVDLLEIVTVLIACAGVIATSRAR